jgi:hypothetical protein
MYRGKKLSKFHPIKNDLLFVATEKAPPIESIVPLWEKSY